jgi:hypothetical protein
VTGVTGLLVSPVSWTHHWVYVVPALITLARDGKRARIAAACAFLLFGLAPLWWTPHSLLRPSYGFHGFVTVVANCYLVAGLLFLAYMGWRAYQTLNLQRRLFALADGEVVGTRESSWPAVRGYAGAGSRSSA